MFNEVAIVSGNSGNQYLAVRKFGLLPNPPLMLMARIGRLDGVSARADRQNEIDDISQRDIALVRAVIAPPTHVKAYPVYRQVSQAMVEGVDAQLLIPPVLRHAHLKIHLPGVGEIRIVDLEDETGADDGLVFLVHGIGEGDEISLVGRVVL